jgi:hypothetical protein
MTRDSDVVVIVLIVVLLGTCHYQDFLAGARRISELSEATIIDLSTTDINEVEASRCH